MGEVRIEKTLCLFCPPGCGIDVHIKDNVPIKVESNGQCGRSALHQSRGHT